MPTTPSSDDTVLTLYPPRMPGATTPVVGGHYGVPKRIYDLEPMGARVEFGPYPGQEPGDTVFLNLDGHNGIDSRQTQSDSDTVILYIPKGMLQSDVVNNLTCSVERSSQNQGTSEPPLELLYNLIRPGNQDRAPGPGENDGHSELELLLPDEIKNGVGPDFPVAGVPVCVSYPYCRAYDRIRLNLNGHDVYHTVTPQEAPLPGSDTPVKVCFTVTRADLAAGGDHAQYRISYTVTDQCGNGPDPDSPWSASQVVDMDLAGRQLVAPDLAEDPDDPTDDPTTIDLTKLGTKDLTVSVPTSTPIWQDKDIIRMTYTATPPSGPVADQLVTADVTRVPFTYKLKVDNAKVLPNSVVRARYELVRNNVVIATSRTAIARVIGEGNVELRPPFLVGATNPIDALAYSDGVTVRIEHLPALTGDTAHLVEVNPLPGTPAFPSPVLNANHRANFNLSSAFLTARHGRVVELKWELIRNGAKVAESPVLALTVNRIPDEDSRLPTPTIKAVTDGVTLDLTSFTGDTSELVQAWTGIAVGQRLWMSCVGTTSSGAPVTLQIHQGTAIGSTGDQSGDVTRAFLDQLGNATQINVFAAVNFSGVANEATAVKFPVRTYTVRAFALENPTLTSVKGSPSNVEIPDNGTTVETSVTLTGTASKGQQVEIFDGFDSSAVSKGTATANATSGIWTLNIPVAAGAHRFAAQSKYHSAPTYSNVRLLTVVAVVIPTISSVKSSPSGVEIPDSGTTVETTVTLTGTASRGQIVEVFDGTGPSAVSKGTTTANATTGIWTLNIPVAAGAHRFAAQSKYHSTPTYSNVRLLTVVAVVIPIISSVKGSPSGVEIPDSGTTVETAVTLTGTASRGQTVEVFDGTGPSAVSKGTTTANATSGIWTLNIPVAAGAHRFAAQSKYHSTPTYSNVRLLTVVAVVTPTISSVKGSPSGVEIPDNGTTVETTVTLTGIASRGQTVEVFDGTGPSAVSRGTATANATTGIWTLNIPVAAGAHRFAAQSKYHSTPTYSNVRLLTVVAIVIPTITSVKGSPSNVEIPPGGTTVETSVILTGKATARLTVQLYNGTTAIGPIITVAANGDWTATLPGLSANTTYNIKARALYGTQPESAVSTFSVVAAVTPSILSAKGSPSGRDILNGGITRETSITLSGKASALQSVRVFNGTSAISPDIPVDGNGDWKVTLNGLADATYNFTARALYGSGNSSQVWKLTVAVVRKEDFESVRAGGVPDFPTMTITGYGESPIWSLGGTPGKIEGNYIALAAYTSYYPTIYHINLKLTCKEISFWYNLHNAPNVSATLEIFNSNAIRIGNFNIVYTGVTQFNFAGNDIKTLKITVQRSNFYMDNFTFKDWD